MKSIHFYKAIGHYCLYYVTDTEYKIIHIFSSKRTAQIYGFFHKMIVHEKY